MDIPNFSLGETWAFGGRIREFSSGSYSAVDISSDTVTVTVKASKDPDADTVFSENADVATDGADGYYYFDVQKAKTNLCTAETEYFVDVRWYYNSGDDNRVLVDSKVACLKSLITIT